MKGVSGARNNSPLKEQETPPTVFTSGCELGAREKEVFFGFPLAVFGFFKKKKYMSYFYTLKNVLKS